MKITGTLNLQNSNIYILEKYYTDKGYETYYKNDSLFIILKGRYILFYTGLLTFFRPDGGGELLKIFKKGHMLKFSLIINLKILILFSFSVILILFLGGQIVTNERTVTLKSILGFFLLFCAIMVIQFIQTFFLFVSIRYGLYLSPRK